MIGIYAFNGRTYKMLFIYLFYYPYSQFVGCKNVYTHSLKVGV